MGDASTVERSKSASRLYDRRYEDESPVGEKGALKEFIKHKGKDE